MREYRSIIPFLRKNKWRYLLGITALLFVNTANLLVPQVMRIFTDWAQEGVLNTQRIAWAPAA